MVDKLLVLRSSTVFPIELHTATLANVENLRQWKNANRFAFFFQEVITPEMQAEWYKAYASRDDDFMFMVFYRETAAGCMGFRMIDGKADVYNVISGVNDPDFRGAMSRAIRLMCSYILSEFAKEIRLKVLKGNPAVAWYGRNGFRAFEEHDTYLELELDLDQFQPVAFESIWADSPP
jgi:hypothetical protein